MGDEREARDEIALYIALALLERLAKERFMRETIPLVLAALLALGIIVIGCFYLVISSTSLRIIWS
jgi:hypothetical protein